MTLSPSQLLIELFLLAWFWTPVTTFAVAFWILSTFAFGQLGLVQLGPGQLSPDCPGLDCTGSNCPVSGTQFAKNIFFDPKFTHLLSIRDFVFHEGFPYNNNPMEDKTSVWTTCAEVYVSVIC